MVENDPKRHMYNNDSPNHLLNFPNSLGLTPLYVAALNGHLNVSFIVKTFNSCLDIKILDRTRCKSILEKHGKWFRQGIHSIS